LIVAYMTEVLGKPIQTFSIGFDDEKFNELPMARAVANHCNTDHHEEIVHPNALGILPEIVKHHGEPFGDQSAIPSWYLSQLARSKVPMVLSGDGGDELFGGYPMYGGWLRRMEKLGWPGEKTLRDKSLAFVRRMLPSRYKSPHCPGDDSVHWLGFVGRFHFEQRQCLWRPELRFLSDAPDYAISKALLATPGVSLSKVRRVDLETFLPDDIMSKVDISTMSCGLEARPPILDRRVFDFARRMTQNELCRVDSAGAFHGKLPLKKILASRLGNEFVNRPKQGFEVPLHRWLYEDVRARGEVHDRLLSRDAVLNQWFETKAIAATVQSENAFNVWLLIVLDEWLRQMKPIS
jgi:asparagine synthase (glutamine-hydrolysing)